MGSQQLPAHPRWPQSKATESVCNRARKMLSREFPTIAGGQEHPEPTLPSRSL